MQEYYVLIPKKLNLDRRLSKFPPDFELSKDYCYYFISELIKEISYKTKKSQNLETVINYYTSRCANINQPIYRDYNLHLDYLHHDFGGEGRMLWRKNYDKGKCYSYKLPQYYWGDGELEIVCITEKNLVNKIKKINKPQIDNIVRKRFNFTQGYFDTKRFELDVESALNLLYQTYRKTGDYSKYLKNAIRLINFKNGIFNFYHKTKTDGRLHTAITQFPKICRKYLKYDGESLAEVDLSSSVPFFLSYLLSIPNTDTKSAILSAQLPYSEDILYHYMLVESSVIPCIKEIAHFRELILNNKLYECFMDDFMSLDNFESSFEYLFDRPFDGDIDELKKYSKKRLLSMFFAHPKKFEQEQAIFYCYFPTIHEVIKKFKKAKFRDFPKSKQHKKVSYMLFQLESYFMLNIIAREINNKFRRKIPFFTLHDCLMVKESQLGQVYGLMQEIFIREIGYSPNMTTKIYR